MSPRPPIERLERLQERITAEVSELTSNDQKVDYTGRVLVLEPIERELIEIISALKEDRK